MQMQSFFVSFLLLLLCLEISSVKADCDQHDNKERHHKHTTKTTSISSKITHLHFQLQQKFHQHRLYRHGVMILNAKKVANSFVFVKTTNFKITQVIGQFLRMIHVRVLDV